MRTFETQSEMAERIRRTTRHLARTIIVALAASGGELRRGQLAAAFAKTGFPPTRGEMSDAIRMLVDAGAVRVTHDGKYGWDMSSAYLTLLR